MGLFFKSREYRSVEKDVKSANGNPAKISNARNRIDKAKLSNSERAELYEKLAEAPRYRNQRDNTKNPESTCNLTSMAMAFEGLGMDLGDSNKVQGEEKLYSDFYKRSRSRIDEGDRANFARSKGLKTNHLVTPSFTDAKAAENWFRKHILPRLELGSQATMGLKSGSLRHVVRLQWVEKKGLRIDDPYGKAVGKKGVFTYQKTNPKTRDTNGDQAGEGDDSFLDWSTVATVCKDRYVQLYDR